MTHSNLVWIYSYQHARVCVCASLCVYGCVCLCDTTRTVICRTLTCDITGRRRPEWYIILTCHFPRKNCTWWQRDLQLSRHCKASHSYEQYYACHFPQKNCMIGGVFAERELKRIRRGRTSHSYVRYYSYHDSRLCVCVCVCVCVCSWVFVSVTLLRQSCDMSHSYMLRYYLYQHSRVCVCVCLRMYVCMGVCVCMTWLSQNRDMSLSCVRYYRVATTHMMPYLNMSFSAKELYD